MVTLHQSDSIAAVLVEAICTGNLESLQRLLHENPGLAAARIQDHKGVSRTPLHIATDWPGYFPNGVAVVTTLVSAGADPNAPMLGCRHSETPLHWAASSDDVDLADALIAAGADVEARGASIGGGTPLDDAVGYGCWQVARLLVERGARVDKLWHAAALGMMSRIEEYFAGPTLPTPSEVNHAFWQACHGGRRRPAEYLLARGADLNWTPDYAAETPLNIAGALDTGREALLSWLRSQGAKSAPEARRVTEE
jgi:ankyrin repeat protein